MRVAFLEEKLSSDANILNLTIKDISNELQVSESYVKNIIYRTLKELCSLFGKECN